MACGRNPQLELKPLLVTEMAVTCFWGESWRSLVSTPGKGPLTWFLRTPSNICFTKLLWFLFWINCRSCVLGCVCSDLCLWLWMCPTPTPLPHKPAESSGVWINRVLVHSISSIQGSPLSWFLCLPPPTIIPTKPLPLRLASFKSEEPRVFCYMYMSYVCVQLCRDRRSTLNVYLVYSLHDFSRHSLPLNMKLSSWLVASQGATGIHMSLLPHMPGAGVTSTHQWAWLVCGP